MLTVASVLVFSANVLASEDGSKYNINDSPHSVGVAGVGDFVTKNVMQTWEGARDYCDNFEDNGFDDWRLPTKEELLELYRAYPNNQMSETFGWHTWIGQWSSTEVLGLYPPGYYPAPHYIVYLANGGVTHYPYGDGYQKFYTACIR